ncbi:MAG: hypothetical protein GX321_05870 [Clostridiales bacterium]|nr:hypothetical protein [Clostridiales bacterium]
MKMKRGILIICIVLSFLFVGCVPTEGNTEVEETQVDPSNNDKGADPDIKDFSWLRDYFKDYEFAVSSNNGYEVSGEYDLNGDGINDKIKTSLSVNSYIEVNDKTLEFYTDNPTGELKIIDLDSNDNYLELACFDDGPSGDPHYKLFRYNGEELIALGEIDSGAIMDGRGKYISWFSMGVNFKPLFYTSWQELVDNEFVSRDHDVSQYIGETYELSGSGFFVPLEEAPKNYHEYISWEWESMKDFESITVKILEIYSASQLFIEFEDGQKGLLYFWIGD